MKRSMTIKSTIKSIPQLDKTPKLHEAIHFANKAIVDQIV